MNDTENRVLPLLKAEAVRIERANETFVNELLVLVNSSNERISDEEFIAVVSTVMERCDWCLSSTSKATGLRYEELYSYLYDEKPLIPEDSERKIRLRKLITYLQMKEDIGAGLNNLVSDQKGTKVSHHGNKGTVD